MQVYRLLKEIDLTVDPTRELAAQANQTAAMFVERFGAEPTWIAAAPGRVNLIGDHVDYSDGFVLPFAIEKYSVVAGAPTDEPLSTICSVQMDASFGFDANSNLVPAQSGWREYVKGVFHGFQSLDASIPQMQMMINSSVPVGSGLSSSAALEVSIATMLESACRLPIGKRQMALLCQKAENGFAKVPCGVMDQFISVFAKQDSALLLDCCDLSFRQIPFDLSEVALLIINSNTTHELASSQYAVRRKRCESVCQKLKIKSLRSLDLEMLQSNRAKLDELEFKRAKHAVTENARTLAFADHLQTKDWQQAGHLMYQSPIHCVTTMR